MQKKQHPTMLHRICMHGYRPPSGPKNLKKTLKFGFWPKKPKILQNDLKLDTYDLKFWGHCGYALYFWYHRYHFLKLPPLRGNITSFFPSSVNILWLHISDQNFQTFKSLVSDFFSNSHDHSVDQCKSDEKTFWGDRFGYLSTMTQNRL